MSTTLRRCFGIITLRELIALAIREGCRDGYEYAEFVCTETDWFGHLDLENGVNGGDVESAWTEAQWQWKQILGLRPGNDFGSITEEQARTYRA